MIDDKRFTDELFQRMYDYGYRKAEIEGETLFFFVDETKYLRAYSPCVPVKCTCFEKKDQLIDVAEYLGIVDWSKVSVDTPVVVWDNPKDGYYKRHFAKYKNGRVYVWGAGATSWSNDGYNGMYAWGNAKLAKGGNIIAITSMKGNNHERLR